MASRGTCSVLLKDLPYICTADAQAPNSIGKIFTMDEEQQVELLSRVDIFESLEKVEVREILKDLLQ